MRAARVFAILSALVFAGPVRAQEPLVYGEGEPAPALHVAEWVRGEPVERLERGRAYLVEFWATWCPASARAVARLSTLQRAHPDLTVIAISARDVQGESLERVRTKVSELSESMAYRVGFDDRRRTSREWLDQFDVRSIPVAFLVNREGVIAWIGNPLWPPGELEDVTARVLAGGFTPAQREAVHRVYMERRERVGRLESELDDLNTATQPGRALRIVEALLQLNPDGAPAYTLKKFELLLIDPGGLDAAYAFGREAVAGVLKDDARGLVGLASDVLNEPGLARRDTDLARAAATRAAELTRRQDPEILDTLALALARGGDNEKAIEAEKRALELATDEYSKSSYAERLRDYERDARDAAR